MYAQDNNNIAFLSECGNKDIWVHNIYGMHNL